MSNGMMQTDIRKSETKSNRRQHDATFVNIARQRILLVEMQIKINLKRANRYYDIY